MLLSVSDGVDTGAVSGSCDTGESQDSSSTTSSLAEDHEVSAVPKKIVLRKAKLKVEPIPALLNGPFSSGIKNMLKLKVINKSTVNLCVPVTLHCYSIIRYHKLRILPFLKRQYHIIILYTRYNCVVVSSFANIKVSFTCSHTFKFFV